MSGELAALAAEVMPYALAAVAAYGGAVLAKARDEAADATVSRAGDCWRVSSGPAGQASRCPARSPMSSRTRPMLMPLRRCGWRCARPWPPIRG